MTPEEMKEMNDLRIANIKHQISWLDAHGCQSCSPDTSNEITTGKGIKVSADPITIEIDKEYFRKKFEKVIDTWHQRFNHIDWEHLLEELMECFDEKDNDDY